ncbi:hypothetical protein VCRLGP7_10045 [Vibrio crassostreae]|nr:hypothetical protein VCRLGP7_10045 [Vibrio crassostreae]CDT32688.1 hypothetical protein VCRLGP107_460034 [Vibrio crassostreae]
MNVTTVIQAMTGAEFVITSTSSLLINMIFSLYYGGGCIWRVI